MGSGFLQDDVRNDVSRVTASVHHLFQKFVKVFENDNLHGVMLPAVKLILQQNQHQLVCFTFDILKPAVLLGNLFDIIPTPKFLQHFQDNVARFFQQGNLLGKINVLKLAGGHGVTFGKLLHRLRNLVKRVAQGLDVLRLQRRHGDPRHEFGDLDADLFPRASRGNKFLQGNGV